jgi:hypothetical protein
MMSAASAHRECRSLFAVADRQRREIDAVAVESKPEPEECHGEARDHDPPTGITHGAFGHAPMTPSPIQAVIAILASSSQFLVAVQTDQGLAIAG